MRLPTLFLSALVLASSCASEGPPRGATSVFLTIRTQSSELVPDALLVSARTRDASIFEAQRLPEVGPLLPAVGSTLGTVTLYVGQTAGWLQIEVIGQVDGVRRMYGVTGVQLVPEHQVSAQIILAIETSDVDAGADSDDPEGDASVDSSDSGGSADVAADVARPGTDGGADGAEIDAPAPDAASPDTMTDARDGGAAPVDTAAPDVVTDAPLGDGGIVDGAMLDASPLSSPFLRLKFDETAGTTASDSSGNRRDAMLLGGVTHVSTGRLGGAVHLDGATGTYLALPANLLDTVRDVTITTWVRVTTASNRSKVFDFGSGSTRTMYLAGQWSGPVRFAITDSGSGGEQALTGTAALAPGVWTHVAVVLAPSGGTLYVDGAAVDSSPSVTDRPLNLAPTPNVWLGRSQNSTTPNLEADLDDFRIYDRALTAAEVAAVHGATL